MNLQLRVDSIKRKNIDFIFNKPEKKRFTELITCTCSKSDECVETEDDSLSLDKDKAYEIFQMQLNESYIYKEKENIFAIIEDITETYNKSKRLEKQSLKFFVSSRKLCFELSYPLRAKRVGR